MHLYGLQLNRTDAVGVQYNMIGVNGAKFSDYNASRYFFSQISKVPADLFVISLGTNEALSLTYAADSMYMALDQFYTRLRQVQPEASILFTAPPDTYYQHLNPNPHTAEIVDIERRYSIAHDCAFWDFYMIMGGLGSVTNWYKQGLGNKDLVHFLRAGYQKQGQLLYRALMKAYLESLNVKK
jgi:lysophospholipase L1-like esterase